MTLEKFKNFFSAFVFLAGSALWSGEAAFADDCIFLRVDLQTSIRNFEALKFENELQQSRLDQKLSYCLERGSEISNNLAAAAAGDACHAAIEVGEIDSQMAALGTECDDSFKKITAFQDDLEVALDVLGRNSEASLQFIKGSEEFLKGCEGGVSLAGKLNAGYKKLNDEAGAVMVSGKNALGKYGAFTEMAKVLHGKTSEIGERCGMATGAMAPTLTRQAAGQVSGRNKKIAAAGSVPKQGPSTVTGDIKNFSLSSAMPPKQMEGPPGVASVSVSQSEPKRNPGESQRVEQQEQRSPVQKAALEQGSRTIASTGAPKGQPEPDTVRNAGSSALSAGVTAPANQAGAGTAVSVHELQSADIVVSGTTAPTSPGGGMAPMIQEQLSRSAITVAHLVVVNDLVQERAGASQGVDMDSRDLFGRVHGKYQEINGQEKMAR